MQIGITLLVIILFYLIAAIWGAKKRIGKWWAFFFLVFGGGLIGIWFIVLSPPLDKMPHNYNKERLWNKMYGFIGIILSIASIKSIITKPSYFQSDQDIVFQYSLAVFGAGFAYYMLNRNKRHKAVYEKLIKEFLEKNEK